MTGENSGLGWNQRFSYSNVIRLKISMVFLRLDVLTLLAGYTALRIAAHRCNSRADFLQIFSVQKLPWLAIREIVLHQGFLARTHIFWTKHYKTAHSKTSNKRFFLTDIQNYKDIHVVWLHWAVNSWVATKLALDVMELCFVINSVTPALIPGTLIVGR